MLTTTATRGQAPDFQNPAWCPGRYCPRCTTRRHQSWATVARCRWRRAEWVSGDPPGNGQCWALLARCGTLTVSLHRTREAAERAKSGIDRWACGGRCSGAHEIVVLGAEVDFDSDDPIEGF